MTLQEAYDTMLVGLHRQGWERSLNPTIDICSYRGDEGRRCAVGLLIPDSVYHPDFEGTFVRGLVEGYPQVQEVLEGLPLDFLGEAQVLHDEALGPEDMKQKFYDLGLRWGLNVF